MFPRVRAADIPVPARYFPMSRTSFNRLAVSLALALPLVAHAQERESLESLRSTTVGLVRALVQQGVLSQEKADEILRQSGVTPPAAATGDVSAAPVAAAVPAAAAGAAGEAASAAPAPAADAAAPAAATTAPAVGATAPNSVRVPYVPEFVKRELREQVRDEVLAKAKEEGWAAPDKLPAWLDRIALNGELTLRFENDLFRQPCSATNTTGCNVPAPQYDEITGLALNNTTTDRQQLRLRAAEGLTVKVNESVQAEVRLSTGSATNPVTNFQTLGNMFTRPTISLDRANFQYRPADWLRVQGGRFSNPFFGTDLLWYERLGFDGVAVDAHRLVAPGALVFGTIGAFPLQDIEPSSTTDVKSKWLYGFQAGGKWLANEHDSVTSALAYYNFTHVEGMPNDATGSNSFNSLSVPTFMQKGNSLFNVNGLNGGTAQYALASQFRELDWTTLLDLGSWRPVHVTWLLDVARNLGFDQNEITRRTAGLATDPVLTAAGLTQPLQARTKAYGTRVTVGKPRIEERGQWQAYAGYKYIQRDAVLDAFTDPDFHLGGTDARGWLAGGAYGIDRDTWLSLKYLATEAIDGPPLSIDVLQLDFNLRF